MEKLQKVLMSTVISGSNKQLDTDKITDIGSFDFDDFDFLLDTEMAQRVSSTDDKWLEVSCTSCYSCW